jgi:hypothetical protein
MLGSHLPADRHGCRGEESLQMILCRDKATYHIAGVDDDREVGTSALLAIHWFKACPKDTSPVFLDSLPSSGNQNQSLLPTESGLTKSTTLAMK